MKFLSYNGVTFDSLNVTASLPNDTPDRERSPNVLARLNQTGFVTGMAGGVRTIPVYFQVKPTYDIETTILALIAALDPDHPDARTLVAQLNDGTTNVQMQVRPGPYIARPGDTKGLLVPFVSDDARWKSATTTTHGPQSFAATNNWGITVGGQGRVTPLVKIGWSVQRPSTSATLGWAHRKSITVTNGSTRALHQQVIQLGPINTAALIAAGKMRSNCADFTVFNERGERLRRSVVGANSRATFFTWVVDHVGAASSRTFDVCYGNPSATFSADDHGFPYSYPGSPTPDITALDGQATGGTTTSISTGQTLDPNRFNGGTMLLTGNTSAGNIGGQYRRIASHTTGGVMTPTRAFTTAPDTTTGYVFVSGPFMGDGGAASAASATSLTDSSQSWNPGEWIGATVQIITLSQQMGTVVQEATVTANTATALTVASWPSGTPAVGAIYRVFKRNANFIYRVDQTDREQTNHRGRWRINKGGVRPSQIWTASDGAPGAWTPDLYNPGNAKNDYNQRRYTYADVGGDNDSFAILNASIARKDGANLSEEGFANGCSLTIPLGILGIRQNYQIKNPSGMARAFFGCREQGGEEWEAYAEYSTAQASLTTISTAYYDLTGYGTPVHLMHALTSDDDADIDKDETGTAQLMDATVLEVRIDARSLTVTDFESATEDSVYDLTLLVRRSTSASETAGDDLIRIGQSEKHLFLTSGHKLWVGPLGDIPLVARIYNGSTYVRDVPWPVAVYRVEADYQGTAQRRYSADVIPLTPGSQTLRVSDPDGSMGTVTVEVLYEAAYL